MQEHIGFLERLQKVKLWFKRKHNIKMRRSSSSLSTGDLERGSQGLSLVKQNIPDALVAGNRNLDFGLATEVHIISNNFTEEGKTGFELH